MSVFRINLSRILLFGGYAVILFIFCNLAPAAQPLIAKGPYLQAPGSNTMTIMWESPVNAPASLFYGEGANPNTVLRAINRIRYSSSTSISSGKITYYVYQATLNNLEPGTTYSYYVQIGNTNTPIKKFRTFNSDKIRFIAYGDTRTNPDTHKRIAQHFKSFSPDFILHTGDLVSHGSRYNVWDREFFAPLRDVMDEIPLFPVIGNHEEKSANFFNYFGMPYKKSFYSFEAGPVFVLALDYHYQKNSEEQYRFAARSLQSTKAKWKIVMVHNPMFNVGGHISGWGHKYYLPLFHKTGVDLVIAGHSHIYERFFPIAPEGLENSSPITHITTGGGGAPLATSSYHPALAAYARTNHFLFFEATSSNIVGRCFDINGIELDFFQIVKRVGKYDQNYIAKVFPESSLRLSLEVATNLIARAVGIPKMGEPVMIMFKMIPITGFSKPVKMEIELSPVSTNFYQIVGGNLTVTTPPVGSKEQIVWVKVMPNPGVIIREKDRELDPPLIFQAKVREGNLEAVAYGKKAYISGTAQTEAEKLDEPVEER